VFKIVDALGIKLKENEKTFVKNDLVRAIFMKWLDAGNNLLEMIVTKLPSPVVA